MAWISCGAPDLIVADLENQGHSSTDPSRRGGLPIGLLPDTTYHTDDVVVEHLSPSAVCVAITDGLFDLSRDEEGFEKIPIELLARLRRELLADSRRTGGVLVEAYRYITACHEYGYVCTQDDVTILVFGPHMALDGVYEATVPLSPTAVDDTALAMGEWCRGEKWKEEDINRVQLILEEKLMNVYDHGFDDRERLHEVVNVRLVKRRKSHVELTVWDCGTPAPSLAVAAGSSLTEFELLNRSMSDGGRGRLIVRELCDGIERKRYGKLNETIYHIRLGCGEGGTQ